MKRTHRVEKMASVYDEEILPLWGQRFARMILRDVVLPPRANVLDVACATGHVALELAHRHEDIRVIAIDQAASLLDVARKKAGDLTHKRMFFRSETLRDRLPFADEVFDLVVCNARLLEFREPAVMLREFARVCAVGKRVVITLPLRGTWSEFFDLYREVLLRQDNPQMLERLDAHIARLPEPDTAVRWMSGAGLQDVELEVEEFRLLFKSSREFFFAPLIEFGPLVSWKEIAGKGESMQQVFWHIKEAIDQYFSGRAFQITVKAGCLRGTRAQSIEATGELGMEDVEILGETSGVVEEDVELEEEILDPEDDS